MQLEINKCHYTVIGNKPIIHCVCRDNNGDRKIVKIIGVEPYFYAPKGTVLPNERNVVRIDSNLPTAKTWEYGSDEIYDKVIVRLPKHVVEIRQRLEDEGVITCQSRVLFPNVFRVEYGVYRGMKIDVPDDFDFRNKYIHISKIKGNDQMFFNMKKLFWDIEVDITLNEGISFDDMMLDGKVIKEFICDICKTSFKTVDDTYDCISEHGVEEKEVKKYVVEETKTKVNAPIICVTLYAEWEDRAYVFQIIKNQVKAKISYKTNEKEFYRDGITKRELSDKREVIYNTYKSETDMSRDIVRLLTRLDFDIWAGFNSIHFDNPKFVNRMEYLRVPYKTISPLNIMNKDVIYGVELMDIRAMLMDLRRKGVKKKSLDWFSSEYLKLGKIDLYDVISDKLKSEHRIGNKIHGLIYHHGNKRDNLLLANYCLEDTMLTFLLDEKNRLITTRLVDENIFGVEYEASMKTVQGSFIYCLRMAKEGGFVHPNTLTGEERSESEVFDGAEVFEPHHGVLSNVICLDFSRHYSTMMRIFNMGIDTINYDVDDLNIELTNGVCFVPKAMRVSYVSKIFDKFIKIRQEKLDKMKTLSPDSEEFKLLGLEEYRIKQKINEFYGFYKWIDNLVDSCVPLMARYFTLYAGDIVKEKTKIKLIAGDTDSLYLWAGDISLENAKRIGEKMSVLINLAIKIHIKERWGIDTDEVNLKFERVCDFGQFGAKKNYTMYQKWNKDWKELPEEKDRYVFKGLKNVRSDNSDMIEDITTKLWKLLLSKKSKNELIDAVKEVYKKIENNEFDYDYLSVPTGFSKSLDEYRKNKANDVSVRSAKNSMLLGIPVYAGDKPKLLMLDKIYNNPFNITEHKRLVKNGVCYFEKHEIADFVDEYTTGISIDYYLNDLQRAVEPIFEMIGIKWTDVMIDGEIITGR